jgi:hypothetical protein
MPDTAPLSVDAVAPVLTRIVTVAAILTVSFADYTILLATKAAPLREKGNKIKKPISFGIRKTSITNTPTQNEKHQKQVMALASVLVPNFLCSSSYLTPA